ncbi:hypothetical protein [Nonomuraea aridisoli]|nr:hypothetical protein [Nonomuraea aridisoli]
MPAEGVARAGAEHADLMEQIPLPLVVDREIAVGGAMSRSMAAEP